MRIVSVETYLVRAAAADRDPGRVEHELGVLVDRALLRTTRRPISARARAEADGRGLAGVEHEALLGQAEVTAGGSHDPPDEEIEKDKEAALRRSSAPSTSTEAKS